VLAKLDSALSKGEGRLAEKAEKAIEGLFFNRIKVYDDKEVKGDSSLTTLSTLGGESGLAPGLRMTGAHGSDRKLTFEDKNSLALQALQEGKVDFTDKRINIKGAATDLKLGSK
jgi:hypothetical protein